MRDTKGMAMAVIGRPRKFDREAALSAAMRVFWRKGYSATSINDLCEAMNIRSPSLYGAFGDKEALFMEAINYYVRTVGPPVWGQLRSSSTARAGVETLLAAASETLPEAPLSPAGCMAAIGAVGDEWPAAIAGVVKEVRLTMLDQLQARLDEGVSNGEMPSSVQTEALSRFYLGVFQGMAVQARDGASAEQLRTVGQIAMAAWPI